ncbi:MAG TPA: hypothetical protein VJZ91_18470, partial [Blastocatellia bacterium]|nr:hypothetical protein [Blastocatellia bacterium]
AYYYGKGVAKDIVAACMWLQIGAAANDEASINNLAGIKQLMTAEQVAEAQRRAAEWQTKHPRPK